MIRSVHFSLDLQQLLYNIFQYFLVAVVVTCEARFRHVNGVEVEDSVGPIVSISQRSSFPISYPNNKRGVLPYNKKYPANSAIYGYPSSGANLSGRSTNTGGPTSYRGDHAKQGPEISSHSLNLDPRGGYTNTLHDSNTYNGINDEQWKHYEKSLFVRPGSQYQNRAPQYSAIGSRFSNLYDGSIVHHPGQIGVNIHSRLPLSEKFKKPSAVQANMKAPQWGPSRYEGNEYSAYNRTPMKSFTADNSNVQKIGYHSMPYDEPTGQPIDIRKIYK